MESKRVEHGGRTYVLNQIPAFQAQKIVFHCFRALKTKDLSSIPDEVILKLCSYIGAVNAGGVEVRLSDEDMIAVNVKDSGVLITLELELLEYNFDFFFDGSLSKTIERLFGRLNKAQAAEEGMREDISKV